MRRWLIPLLSVALCGLALAFVWWLRSPLHLLPLERDEGAYVLIASRWLAGDIPYRDLFDHKPPVIYLAYGLSRLVPAEPVAAVRVLATLYVMSSGLVVLALGWRLYGRWAGLAGLALFFAYSSSQRFQGLTFNSEAVMVLPATLGCLLAVTAFQTHVRVRTLLFLAGVCAGLAALAKPVGGVLLIVLCGGILLLPGAHRQRRGAALIAAGGVLLPWLTVIAYFAYHGALPALYEALIAYNRLYAAESLGFGSDPIWLWRIWQPMLVLFLPGAAGLLFTLRTNTGRTSAHLLTAAWGLALLATAVLSVRDFPHYYLAAVPFFSIWAGALLALVAMQVQQTLQRWLGAGIAAGAGGLTALMLLAALLLPPVQEVRPFHVMTPAEQIFALYGYDGIAHFWPSAEVAAFLRAQVGAGDAVFIWAAEPQIYYLADIPPTTRFVYDYPVDRLPGARDEVLRTLNAAPPSYIITYRDVRPIGFYPFAEQQGYRLVATIGGFDVFAHPDS